MQKAKPLNRVKDRAADYLNFVLRINARSLAAVLSENFLGKNG